MNWKRVFGRLHVRPLGKGVNLHSTLIELYGAKVRVYILVWSQPGLFNDFYITLEEVDPNQQSPFLIRDWLERNCIYSEEDFYGDISRIDLKKLHMRMLTKLLVK